MFYQKAVDCIYYCIQDTIKEKQTKAISIANIATEVKVTSIETESNLFVVDIF